ncbi:hypothetical protein ACQY0O_001706 [Thecaphora frezii]
MAHPHSSRSKPPWRNPVFLLLLLWLGSTASAFIFGSGRDALSPVRNAIDQRRRQRAQLLAWSQGNLSGMANWSFRYDPDSLQPLLTHIPADLATPDGAAYYHNLTGFYKGTWSGWDFASPEKRKNATRQILDSASDAQPGRRRRSTARAASNDTLTLDRGDFPWFSSPVDEAHLSFNLDQDHVTPGLVSMVRGSLSVEAPASSRAKVKEVDFDLVGLHFLPTGSVFILATAEEVDRATDVRNVLRMIPKHERSVNLTVSALESDFDQRIQRLQDIIDSGRYDPGEPGAPRSPAHNCSLHIYAKLKPAGRQHEIPLVEALEMEQERPTGISTIRAAPLAMTARIYSPECQLLLTSEDIDGLTKTRLWKKAVNYAAVYFVVLLVQARLLVQQMEVTRTPSGLAKVSYRTWGLQSMLDAYVGLAHLSVGIALNNETTVPLMACAFMSCMLFLAFGYRYALTIYRTQAPESEAAVPAAPAAPTATPATNLATGVSDAASSATATQPADTGTNAQAATAAAAALAMPATSAEDALETRRRTYFLVGFVVLLFMSVFFPLLFAEILLPILYSFWIPQIYRNVQKGTRRAIQTKCIVGTTACRLVLPLYLFACPDNVLFTTPTRWIYVLVGYVVLQMAVLLLQDMLGPHFFLPPSRRPASAHEQWNWHPPISELEPVRRHDTDAGETERSEEAEWSLGDCAICLNGIVPVEAERRSSVAPGASLSTTTRRKKRTTKARHRSRFGNVYVSIEGEEAGDDDDDDNKDNDQDRDGADTPSDLESGGDGISHSYPPEKGEGGSLGIGAASRTASWTRTYGIRPPTWRSRLASAVRSVWQRIGANPLRRRRTEVMVAPCKHIFHTACLERWMTIKTECPSCRRPLPPV